MLKLSSSRGIRIDVPVLSVSCPFADHSVIIQALKKGLIEHEASDTGGVPRWKSSCPDRLTEATGIWYLVPRIWYPISGKYVLDLPRVPGVNYQNIELTACNSFTTDCVGYLNSRLPHFLWPGWSKKGW